MENVTNTLLITLSEFLFINSIFFLPTLFPLTFFIVLNSYPDFSFFLFTSASDFAPSPSAVGYGGIDKGGFNDAIPPAYWQYAYQFAGQIFKFNFTRLFKFYVVFAYLFFDHFLNYRIFEHWR